jgi:hypothetical protein
MPVTPRRPSFRQTFLEEMANFGCRDAFSTRSEELISGGSYIMPPGLSERFELRYNQENINQGENALGLSSRKGRNGKAC